MNASLERAPTPRRTAHQSRRRTCAAPPDLERVRARAYAIFLARCRTGAPGNELSDWLQAERETGGLSPSAPCTCGRDAEAMEAKARARGEILLRSGT
jgi:Protein of unknown function (DUF2934)